MTDFEQDQRESNRILREWITDKTGTTDWERAGWSIGMAMNSAVLKSEEIMAQFTGVFLNERGEAQDG